MSPVSELMSILSMWLWDNTVGMELTKLIFVCDLHEHQFVVIFMNSFFTAHTLFFLNLLGHKLIFLSATFSTQHTNTSKLSTVCTCIFAITGIPKVFNCCSDPAQDSDRQFIVVENECL